MSRADLLYRETCARILREGVWDTDQSVRPRWADGSPAHTVKCFGVVNRYDLQEEFPLMTLLHLLALMRGGASVDLAEEVEQRPRPRQPYLGQLGR